jgi:predicted outer membrane repeat protein
VAPNFPGGGLFNNGSLTMSGCTFTNNSANSGGAYSNGVFGIAVVTNCTFSGNTAATAGGGIANSSQVGITLHNCTIVGNAGGQNGAGVFNAFNSVLTITNSIVAGSTGGIDVSGPFTDGGHNIFADGFNISHPTTLSGDPMLGPLADNGGLTMTHALKQSSIAIDAGNCAAGEVEVDQRGVSRPQGKGCDIGAYELDVPSIPGDLNGDGVVDGADLLILLAAWGKCADPDDCPADLNDDGTVDGADLLILLANWG